MLERGDAEQLARINSRGGIKIIQAAHLPREIRLRQDPSASETADAVHLRQTAGDHELRSEMERRAWRALVNCIEVNLIDEHKRANAPCGITDFAQNRSRSKRAGWIV